MTYKESFLRFMVDCGVLTFGEFTLKSGRKAPYFINAGNYHSGAQLMELGRYYAACIAEHNIPVETVFGPAKISMSYSDRHTRVFRWQPQQLWLWRTSTRRT